MENEILKEIEEKTSMDIRQLNLLSSLKHLLKTQRGGSIVFDPFVGSGTSCLAAKQLGLNYLGFEINKEYYKIAVDRLNGIDQKGQTDLFDTDFDTL